MVLEAGKEQSHFVALEGGKEQGEDWCILPTASQSVSTIWSDKNQPPWELKAKKGVVPSFVSISPLGKATTLRQDSTVRNFWVLAYDGSLTLIQG